MWPNPQKSMDLVTLTEELMENFIFSAVVAFACPLMDHL